jgi:hypothetical protein
MVVFKNEDDNNEVYKKDIDKKVLSSQEKAICINDNVDVMKNKDNMGSVSNDDIEISEKEIKELEKEFYREEIGNIRLEKGRNGKNGFGLEHIREQRMKDKIDIESFLNNVENIINEGDIYLNEGRNTTYIIKDNYIAILNVKNKNIITSYKTDKNRIDKIKRNSKQIK